MPQHDVESTRSPWKQGLRPPWMTRLAGVQSPASSGAESDTESSSTESERVSDCHVTGGRGGAIHEIIPGSCRLEQLSQRVI